MNIVQIKRENLLKNARHEFVLMKERLNFIVMEIDIYWYSRNP